jgi:hypothetical protein
VGSETIGANITLGAGVDEECFGHVHPNEGVCVCVVPCSLCHTCVGYFLGSTWSLDVFTLQPLDVRGPLFQVTSVTSPSGF